MIRGSTTSIKDKVLPFPYHVCCGSAGIPSSGTEREHLLAVPVSLYVIAPRLPSPSVPQIVPFPYKVWLAPSFADVLPYRLLLLHLNSRLHARRQYRTSVTLMMALHDVARHSVPSSIEIGTREYKNPLCRNPSGFATEVFCTRTTASYRTYSALKFGAFSNERPRAVGGWSVPNKEKKLFPLTLFL